MAPPVGISYSQWSLVYNALSFGIAGMESASIFFWLQLANVNKSYRTALTITGLVTAIATYHYMRIFNSWVDAFTVSNSNGGDYQVVLSGAPLNDRYVDWLLTVPLLTLVMKLPQDETVKLSTNLDIASAAMICHGYPGEIQDDLSVRWFWWALSMVPFCYVVATLVAGLGEATSKQPEAVRGLVTKARFLTVISRLTYPGVYIVKNMRVLDFAITWFLVCVQVGAFQGRMVDTHPTVLVKKNLLMPHCGVRGKSGGLNFVVDLLQFQEGFIGTGDEDDRTPERMLFGIFDARHLPSRHFWKHCLPKFMNNTDFGYTYEVNEQVCMVQAPQTFANVAVEEDILDVLNGMTFNIMNVRNRCGGVTSCGTNAIWQINAREFSRKKDESVTEEYFDSRTKIEDTASTHLQFCRGKRSVYVQEKISIAKLNSDYLCAMQRWAEGTVQLFWLQLFRDKTWQLVLFGFSVVGFLGLIYASLYGP